MENKNSFPEEKSVLKFDDTKSLSMVLSVSYLYFFVSTGESSP